LIVKGGEKEIGSPFLSLPKRETNSERERRIALAQEKKKGTAQLQRSDWPLKGEETTY